MAAAPNYGPLYQAAGQAYDIDPLLLQSIAKVEGGVTPQGQPKTSSAGAVGLMQFMPQTAVRYGVNPDDPTSSVFGAARYLADLRQQTNDNLPQMLSLYGGDPSGKYAANVQGVYKPLVAAWSTPPSAQQVVDESTPTPPPGQRNASFNPPPNTPDVFIPEGVTGQAGQPAPGTRTTASSETGGVSFAWKGAPGGAAQGGNAPPADFQGAIFGPSQPSPTPPKGQPTQAAAAPPPTGDFQGEIFGPAPSAPAPAAPPATVEGAPIGSPSQTPPPSAVGAPAAAAPIVPPPATAAPRNNPLISNFAPTGIPLLDEAGTGIEQGVRDVGQTLNNIDAYLTANVPAYAAANRAIGYTPEVAAQTKAATEAQSKAYEQQYPGNWPAAIGRIGGNILAVPAEPAAAVGEVYGAMPWLGRYLGPLGEWATAGGLQNMLTSAGETPEQWQRDFETGGVGGAVLGGATSVLGRYLTRARTALQQEAQNLGLNLSWGELAGGLGRQLESYSQYLPFSGAAEKAAEHRATIANVLNRNMGMPETGVLNLDTLNQARTKIGGMLDQIKNLTVDTNQDPGLLNDLATIRNQAGQENLGPVTNMVNHVETVIANHGLTLPGDALHHLIENGSDLDNLIGSETPNVARYAARIKGALLDAASRTGDPALYPNATQAARDAVDQFNQGRYFYKTLKTVEPLVTRTGDVADQGYLGVANRIQGTAANPNFDSRFQYQNGEMQQLGRVLRGILPDLKSSGTGRELITHSLLLGEGGLLAAALLGPEHLENYFKAAAIPMGLGALGGRISRFGMPPWLHMLTQRLAGPYVGNMLTGTYAPAPAQ